MARCRKESDSQLTTGCINTALMRKSHIGSTYYIETSDPENKVGLFGCISGYKSKHKGTWHDATYLP